MPELRKYYVRDAFIEMLEAVIYKKSWQPLAVCERARETFDRRRSLALKGVFVPSLVDTAQFFADRDCYVALLLLLQLALDKGIEQRNGGEEGVEILKKVHRSITKYLIVERNLYVGRPAFEGTVTPRLWQALNDRKPELTEWWRLYERALLGGHGLSYPGQATALGWVDTVNTGAATLAICWLEDQQGHPLREESFTELEVPLEVVVRGHSDEALSPILLVGRSGNLDGSEGQWVAHRIPDIDESSLFIELETEPWYHPNVAAWQNLFDRFTGRVPELCPVSEVEDTEVKRRYADYARAWFAGRMPPELFEHIFGIAESSSVVSKGKRKAKKKPAPEPESMNVDQCLVIQVTQSVTEMAQAAWPS